MKKTVIYLSLFATAFLVSCKSNEVEETPVVEKEEVEVVVEEPVIEEVIEEPVVEETSNKTKKPVAKNPGIKAETATTPTTTGGSKANKIKDAQNAQAISNSAQEAPNTTNKASKIKASTEQ